MEHLQGITAADMTILRQQQSRALEEQDKREQNILLDITTPICTGDNHENFILQFNQMLYKYTDRMAVNFLHLLLNLRELINPISNKSE